MWRLLREHLAPAVVLFARLAWGGLSTRSPSLCRPTPRRIAVMLVFLPALAIVQCVHWVGFLLDEVLFPRYRDVSVREPVFIVGPPRSGTTLMHRTLAQDPQFTTLSLWELCFALSITAKKLWLAAARLDRAVGRPVARLLHRMERLALRGLDGVHPASLNAPEEDYLALAPVGACFLLVIPFPNSQRLWRLSRFDESLSKREKHRILSFYRLCLQKHLYARGVQARILAKNASFGSWVAGLREAFPACRIVCCMRDPIETVPSLLNAIEPGLIAFDVDRRGGLMQQRMLGMMRHCYEHLLGSMPPTPDNHSALVTLEDLHRDLHGSVMRIYRRLRLQASAAFERRLAKAAVKAKAYSSPCAYTLGQFGLDAEGIRRQFDVYYRWQSFDVASSRGAAVVTERRTAGE